MTAEMSPEFARSLRAELVDRATRRPRRRWVRVTGLAAVLAAIPAAGGIAYATGLLLPGSTVVSEFGDPVSATYVGSATIDLGDRPSEATEASVALRCLTAGSFTFEDGARIQCSDEDARRYQQGSAVVTAYQVPLADGATATTVEVLPAEARWTATVSYANSVDSVWATNSSGQTYGVENSHGTPDLVAVWASNGQLGYALASELFPEDEARGTGEIQVYECDGTTVIGEFTRGMDAGEPNG